MAGWGFRPRSWMTGEPTYPDHLHSYPRTPSGARTSVIRAPVPSGRRMLGGSRPVRIRYVRCSDGAVSSAAQPLGRSAHFVAAGRSAEPAGPQRWRTGSTYCDICGRPVSSDPEKPFSPGDFRHGAGCGTGRGSALGGKRAPPHPGGSSGPSGSGPDRRRRAASRGHIHPVGELASRTRSAGRSRPASSSVAAILASDSYTGLSRR